eukprot:570876-Pyramimonas_sp.AAC.1
MRKFPPFPVRQKDEEEVEIGKEVPSLPFCLREAEEEEAPFLPFPSEGGGRGGGGGAGPFPAFPSGRKLILPEGS